MTERVFNFSAGPAMLPEPVLRQAQEEMMSLPGLGMSVLEISHRSAPYIEIQDEAQANLRQLLGISDDYDVLLLQGGSRLQFSMIPINLMLPGGVADYL
ncbi:MAG: aminotransferase class V-fold PLP-dependent enzyme, partial [Planctomycetales bacterium]|nr:aminotransferase class V-fold PLP-dependent enzyme [Planctomycetales bacterium]